MKQQEVTGCSLFQEQCLKRISCQRLIKKGKKEQKTKQKKNNTPHTSRHKWGTREGCFDVAQHGLSANISLTFQAALNFYTYNHDHCLAFLCKVLGDIWAFFRLVLNRNYKYTVKLTMQLFNNTVSA